MSEGFYFAPSLMSVCSVLMPETNEVMAIKMYMISWILALTLVGNMLFDNFTGKKNPHLIADWFRELKKVFKHKYNKANGNLIRTERNGGFQWKQWLKMIF